MQTPNRTSRAAVSRIEKGEDQCRRADQEEGQAEIG